MPKSFSEDGAFGASGPPQGTAGTFGNQPGGVPGTGASGMITDAQALAEFGPGAFANGALNGMGGVFQQAPASNDPVGSQAWNSEHSGGGNLNMMFEDGGSVPEQDQSGDPTSGTGDPISLALTTVDSALAYGRKLNGLPTDDGSSPQQMAMGARMPSIPGTQSNSGTKPIQPMPGPLPPTSNPFGKRADNSQGDGDSDDATPTIPEDDGDEETA
jgi:hypothetical protein